MNNLKPCPFCGSTKLIINHKSRRAGYTGIDAIVDTETYSVRCTRCHARGGTASGMVLQSLLYVYRDNMPEWATTRETLTKKAIEVWNVRTSDEK